MCVHTHSLHNVFAFIKNTCMKFYVTYMYTFVQRKNMIGSYNWVVIIKTFWGDMSLYSYFLKILSNQTKAK